jgi:hypothetical protein
MDLLGYFVFGLMILFAFLRYLGPSEQFPFANCDISFEENGICFYN